MSKTIAIIGCGNVGSTIAYNIYNRDICDLVLLNHNKIRALSNMYDITDEVIHKKHKIVCGDYSDIDSVDIIINCAGNSNLLRSLDRNSEFDNSRRIADDIISNLNKHKFNGIFINVMNPCDAITYLFKDLDIPNHKILGTGTLLETLRLRRIVYEQFNKCTNSYIVGNHGVNNVIIPRDILSNCKDLNSLLNKVQNRVWDIYSGKGFTNFGIANAVVYIIYNILFELENELCISTLLGDVYGVFNHCVSVPCILNNDGIKRVNVYEDVQNQFDKLFRKEM